MKISILSKAGLYRLIETNSLTSNTAVISFADFGCDFLDVPPNVDQLKIEFDDIRPNNITKEQLLGNILPEAPIIAQFVNQKLKEGKDIICQCDYGISRSAGLAAAILERYAHKGIEIFRNYRYSPNQIVFNRVYKELQKL